MSNPTPTQQSETLDQLCPWCAESPDVHDKNNLGIRYLGCPTRGCTGRSLGFIIDHLWNTRRAAVDGPQGDAEWIAETTAREYVSKSLMPDDAKLELSRNDYWQRAKGAEKVLERIRAAATSSPAPADKPNWNAVLAEFADTAIKCHIGFKHEGPWDKCEWIECEDRRKLIRAAATPPATAGDALGACVKCGHTARRWHGFCQERAGENVISDQVCGCECDAPTPSSPARAAAEELIEHVAYSGVEFDGQKDYIVVQIDRDIWQQIQKLASNDKGGRLGWGRRSG